MGNLKKYREVGIFDVLSAPLNPIGAFNAEQFKADALELMAQGTQHLVVDLGKLDFLYSDAFNAFLMVNAKLAEKKGTLGILTADPVVIKNLQNSGVDRVVRVFSAESEVMALSLERMAKKKKIATEAKPAPVENMEPVVAWESKPASVSKGRAEPSAPPTIVVQNNPTPPVNQVPEMAHHRTQKFTQSFNSAKLEDLNLEDLDDPRQSTLYEEGSGSSGGVWIFIIAFLVVAAFAAWYFLPQ